MRAVRTFLLAALMETTGWTFTCAAERVDLLLVLAADISRSVDEVKFQLQRLGYAAAFSDPRSIVQKRRKWPVRGRKDLNKPAYNAGESGGGHGAATVCTRAAVTSRPLLLSPSPRNIDDTAARIVGRLIELHHRKVDPGADRRAVGKCARRLDDVIAAHAS
jgi:hypothetical protein